MAAAENKRSGAIETVKQRQPSVPFAGGKKRDDQKAKGKDRQRTDRLDPIRQPRKHFGPFGRRLCANQLIRRMDLTRAISAARSTGLGRDSPPPLSRPPAVCWRADF